MAYYGSGPPPRFNPGQMPHRPPHPMFGGLPLPPADMYGHPPHPEMYQGYDEYDGMHSHGQEYYDQHSQYYQYHHGGHPGDMHQPPTFNEGYQQTQTLRPHFNPRFIPPEKPVQEEPTKILRNPYPAISKEEIRSQQKDEIYDPSCPTISAPTHNSGPVEYNSTYSQNAVPFQLQHQQPHHPPPSTGYSHNIPQQHLQPVPTPPAPQLPPQQHLPPPQQHVPPPPQQHMPPPMMANTVTPSTVSIFGENISRARSNKNSKMQIMTGIVTQMQPGSFGMISEEIFFQESCVTGPLPKLGDKVVVEAEPVSGMPFKFNGKKVTRLDIDLVREEKTTNPPQSQSNQNAPHPHQLQNFTSSHLAPLPTMPKSLNLPKSAPQSLSTFISSSQNPPPPLKSILKRRESPTLKRNPPPPPLISKKGTSSDNFTSSFGDASSYKPSTFTFAVGLNQDEPKIFSGGEPGPAIDFPEYTYVREPENFPFQVERKRSPSPRITRLLPQSPVIEFRKAPKQHDAPPPEQREMSPVRNESLGRRHHSPSPPERYASGSSRNARDCDDSYRSYSPATRRSRSRSKSPKRRAPRNDRSRSFSPRRRSHSRSPSPSRRRSRSRSASPQRVRRRSKSRSASPQRVRRRSRSGSPHRLRRRSRSDSPSRGQRKSKRSSSRSRRRSRSASPRSRHRSRSGSPRSRRRSRSVTPKSRRKISRSPSPTRNRQSSSRSRFRRTHHSHRSRSKSRSSTPSLVSISTFPHNSRHTGNEIMTHGIVAKAVSSDLFPKIVERPGPGPTMPQVSLGSLIKAKAQPVPIKFQISNPNAAKPPPPQLVPNPSFMKTGLQNPAFNITKTVENPAAWQSTASKKKKPKEQEPAFRIVDDMTNPKNPSTTVVTQIPREKCNEKIKQWEAERQALKSKVLSDISSENLVTNPANIAQLKNTIQNDLHQLRAKASQPPGKNLLENPTNIQQLKQTVARDLNDLKNKSTSVENGPPSSGSKPLPVDIQHLKTTVQQGLKELRSMFEDRHPKESESLKRSQNEGTSNIGTPTESKSNETGSTGLENSKKTGITGPDSLKKTPPVKDVGKKIPTAESRRDGSRSRSKTVVASPPPPTDPPISEEMEKLKEEIHRQRFIEEENRLRAIGDEAGLNQLWYMEDRRRRRLEEQQLSRIRMREIQLKKEKKFGELAVLRQEWGPPSERMEHERQLRQARQEEERQETQLEGQSEAIRRQEMEYQLWLEDEATARSREFGRTNRGFEGRVKRRRTPSPSQNIPPQHQQAPHSHHTRRRRSRSASYERYRNDWRHRPHRERSPEMDYEQFVKTFGGARMPMHPDMPHPRHHPHPPPGYHPHAPPGHHPHSHPDFVEEHEPFEQDGFFISRAIDDVSRRQEELMHREMEIEQRMEMAEMRIGPPPNQPHPRDRDYGRFAVRRR